MQTINLSALALFSFSIEEYVDEEDVSSSDREQDQPDIRDQLSTVLQLLYQDTSILLEDAKPIQILYKQIQTQLFEDLAAALTPASFIESHYLRVQEARKRIIDWESNQRSTTHLETDRLKAKEFKQQANELTASSLATEQSLKKTGSQMGPADAGIVPSQLGYCSSKGSS